jgi:hypothetical protein
MKNNSTIQEMGQIESGILAGRNFGSIEKSGIPREESPALPETLTIEGEPSTGGVGEFCPPFSLYAWAAGASTGS